VTDVRTELLATNSFSNNSPLFHLQQVSYYWCHFTATCYYPRFRVVPNTKCRDLHCVSKKTEPRSLFHPLST